MSGRSPAKTKPAGKTSVTPPVPVQVSTNVHRLAVCILDAEKEPGEQVGSQRRLPNSYEGGDDGEREIDDSGNEADNSDDVSGLFDPESPPSLTYSTSLRGSNLQALPVVVCDRHSDPQRFTVYNGKDDTHNGPAAAPTTAETAPLRSMRLTVSNNGTIARQTSADDLIHQSVSSIFAEISDRHISGLWDNEDIFITAHQPAQAIVPVTGVRSDSLSSGTFAGRRSAGARSGSFRRQGDEVELVVPGQRTFRQQLGQFLEEAAVALVVESQKRSTPFYAHKISVSVTVVPRKIEKVPGARDQATKETENDTRPQHSAGKESVFQTDQLHVVTPCDSVQDCNKLPSLLALQYQRAAAVSGHGLEMIVIVLSLVQVFQNGPQRVCKMRIVDLGQRTVDDPLMSAIQAVCRQPSNQPTHHLPHSTAGNLARRNMRRERRVSQSSHLSMKSFFLAEGRAQDNADDSGDEILVSTAYNCCNKKDGDTFNDGADSVARSAMSGVSDKSTTSTEIQAEVLRRMAHSSVKNAGTEPSAATARIVFNLVLCAAPTLYDAIDHIHACTYLHEEAPFVVQDSFLDCLELLDHFKVMRKALLGERQNLKDEIQGMTRRNNATARKASVTALQVDIPVKEFRRRNSAVLSLGAPELGSPATELSRSDEGVRFVASRSNSLSASTTSIFSLDALRQQLTASAMKVAALERTLSLNREEFAKRDSLFQQDEQQAKDILESVRVVLATTEQRLDSAKMRFHSIQAKTSQLSSRLMPEIENAVKAFDANRHTALVPEFSLACGSEVSSAGSSTASRVPQPPRGKKVQLDHTAPLKLRPDTFDVQLRPAPVSNANLPAATGEHLVVGGSGNTPRPAVSSSLLQRKTWLIREISNCEKDTDALEREVCQLHASKRKQEQLYALMMDYRVLSETVLEEMMLLTQGNSAAAAPGVGLNASKPMLSARSDRPGHAVTRGGRPASAR